MSQSNLLQYVPAEARYHYKPLDDEQNAVSYWSEAAAALGEFEENLHESLYGYLDDEDDSGKPRLLEEPHISRLRTFVEDKKQVFELLRSGVQCRRVQFYADFDEQGGIEDHVDSMSSLRDLATAWLALARVRIAEGRYADAARELTDCGEMGYLLCCGESFVLQYLVGLTVSGIAQTGFRLLAAEGKSRGDSLDDLIVAVDRWIDESDQAARCYRVELCRFVIPEIDHLTACGSVESQVDRLLDHHYPNEPFPDEDGQPTLAEDDIESRRQWRRDGIVSLVENHPHPFDPVATVRQLGQLVADQIARLQHRRFSWTAPLRELGRRYRQSRFKARTRHWPNQFLVDFPFSCLGPGEHARQQVAELLELMGSQYRAELEPPSEPELQAARDRLRSVPNALGLLVAHALLPMDIFSSENLHRERLRTTREALANARSGPGS